MKMPSKGTFVLVEGYGGAIFAGACNLQSNDPTVLLKFEGGKLDKGYGRGIVEIPLKEFKENRVYPEQVAEGDLLIESTWKRDKILDL